MSKHQKILRIISTLIIAGVWIFTEPAMAIGVTLGLLVIWSFDRLLNAMSKAQTLYECEVCGQHVSEIQYLADKGLCLQCNHKKNIL